MIYQVTLTTSYMTQRYLVRADSEDAAIRRVKEGPAGYIEGTYTAEPADLDYPLCIYDSFDEQED